MNDYKVSVIVPVYKVEDYIAKCAISLFQQTMKEIQFIFVDDCSPDRSVTILQEVIKDFPSREKDVLILHNSNNRGPLQSRLYASSIAKGKYISFVDSDDWVDSNMFELLYKNAINDEVSIVISGITKEYVNWRDTYLRSMIYTSGKNILYNIPNTGFELFSCACLIKNDVNFKEILSGFYNNPEWEYASMWEDVAFMFCLYTKVEKIGYLNASPYHYNRQNVNSTLTNKNEKIVRESLKVVDFLKLKFSNEKKLRLTMQYLTLGAKAPLIRMKGPKVWRNEHPVSNISIIRMSSIPYKLRLAWVLMNIGISFPYYWGEKLNKMLKKQSRSV